MALGEAVFAEAFDLAEAALGEVLLVAAFDHALDQLLAERMDRANTPERRHGAAQAIGLAGREAAGDDGDLHRLLLEQGHAQGLAEHVFQRLGRERHALLAVAAAQVGVDHVALDRTGPHDRHLDHQVVEVARLHARQERHLGPALDLEHAQAVGPAQHVVDARILGRRRRQVEAAVVMPGQQVEALAHAGQHAERQHVDLEDAGGGQVVLVPFDDRAVRHRRVLDRHQIVEPSLGDDEAADMLAQMPGKADQLLRQLERQRQGSGPPGRGRGRAPSPPARPRSTSPRPGRPARRPCPRSAPWPCRPRARRCGRDS